MDGTQRRREGAAKATATSRKTWRSVLSLFLSMTMAVGTVPTQALAEALEPEDAQEVVAPDDTEVQEQEEPETLLEEQPAENAAPEQEPNPEGLTLEATVPEESYAPGGKANNDDLLDAYAQQRIDETLPEDKSEGEVVALGMFEPIGDSLTGSNKIAYDTIKPQILDVAAGKRTSTAFEIPVSALTEKYEWTAAELGVDDIAVYDEARQGYVITTDATNAAYLTFAPSLRTVVFSLTADCPYELYWYNKTAGTSTGKNGILFGAYFDHDNDEWILTLNADVNNGITYETQAITYYFSVAQAYAAGDYEVNTSQAERIENALADAQAIVDAHESDSVYDRLDAYKDAICDRVEYDQDAADDKTTPYGDPWQLISVFDGDGSTNVVCEGYSKAFKYLCDLSAQPGGETIVATGDMDGGTGAGAHMWNIVTMDDGRNYLVDVTNCDEGSAGHGRNGAQDALFVAIPTSGSVTDGYTFDANDKSIGYIYNNGTNPKRENMFELYGEDALTLSDEPYDPDASGTGELSLDDWNFEYRGSSTIVYTGEPVELPELYGYRYSDDAQLVQGVNFAFDHFEDENGVTLDEAVDSGRYWAFYSGTKPYAGTIGVRFDIAKAAQRVTLGAASYSKTYGQAAFSVGATRTKGDGALSYASSNASVATVGADGKVTIKGTGTATITVTATETDNYKKATATATVTVVPKAITPTVTLSATSCVYDGKAKTPSVTVKDGSKALAKDRDYTVTYASGRKAVGSYSVKVTLKGNYKGSKTVSFKVVPATPTTTVANAAGGVTVKWSKAAGAAGYYVYRKAGSGSYAKVKTIASAAAGSWTDAAVKAKDGTTYAYYVVAYGGTAKIAGGKKAASIVRLSSPAAPGATNLSGRKAKFTWKKNAKAAGYQVQWSTSSTFASGNTTKKIDKNTTLTYTASSLAKGKTYYVRVRAYKKVGTATYYSAWSAEKSVKITK